MKLTEFPYKQNMNTYLVKTDIKSSTIGHIVGDDIIKCCGIELTSRIRKIQFNIFFLVVDSQENQPFISVQYAVILKYKI